MGCSMSWRALQLIFIVVACALIVPASGYAASGSGGIDPFSSVLLALAVLLSFALVGSALAKFLKKPAVLGELLFGMLAGNLLYQMGHPLGVFIMHQNKVLEMISSLIRGESLLGEVAARVFSTDELASGGVGALVVSAFQTPAAPLNLAVLFALIFAANLGIILLLFLVGFESTVSEMKRVGVRAGMVAMVGVVAPALLGFGVSWLLLPEANHTVHLFIGAILCATSVGITARVFRDMNIINSGEAKIVLGAAVIDDILGLLVLAVVVGIVNTGHFSLVGGAKLLLTSLVAIGALLFCGEKLFKRPLEVLSRVDQRTAPLLLSLILAFLLSWAAAGIGLASIIGAFMAGLILTEEHFPEAAQRLKHSIEPLERTFAPVFFVLMGAQVNLETLLNVETLGLAAALTVAASLGKLFCGLVAGADVDRLTIGIGMLPRGEVGLIFAGIGKALGVISGGVFSAVIVMVILTTVATPIGLSYAVRRRASAN